MTDAEAISQVKDFLETDPAGEPPLEAIAVVLARATQSQEERWATLNAN